MPTREEGFIDWLPGLIPGIPGIIDTVRDWFDDDDDETPAGPATPRTATPPGMGSPQPGVCYKVDPRTGQLRAYRPRRRRRRAMTASDKADLAFLKSQGVPAKEAAGLIISRAI